MGFRTALLAWPDEGLRLCRQGDANMGWRQAGFGAPCWRGSTEDKGFAGRATPTWAPAARERTGLVGVTRRWIKALPAGRRQHGRRQGGKRRILLAWPASGQRRKDGVSVTCERTKERAKPPHMNCDCSALYLLNCPADSTYRICLPSLPRRS